MRASTSRVLLLAFASALLATACANPYNSTPADTLAMPKKKAPKADPNAGKVPIYGGLNEPDTCKVDFNGKEQKVASKPAQNKAWSLTQDALNAMAGAENAIGNQRRGQAIEGITISSDALRVDPYSPSATLAMAHAYALVGKKRCALDLLGRLADLGALPEIAADVGKMKAQAKTDVAFEPFRKEADGKIGN
jgi:hypothetical protein